MVEPHHVLHQRHVPVDDGRLNSSSYRTRSKSNATRPPPYTDVVARVVFTKNLQRHVPCPPTVAPGHTVREVLEHIFVDNARLRGYVVDETGALRKHMSIFVDGHLVTDRKTLSDGVGPESEIYVMQALSGGST